jgi:hypothetical protein
VVLQAGNGPAIWRRICRLLASEPFEGAETSFVQIKSWLRHVIERQQGNTRVPGQHGAETVRAKLLREAAQMSALRGYAVNVIVQSDGKLRLVGGLALPTLTASHFACIWVAHLALRIQPSAWHHFMSSGKIKNAHLQEPSFCAFLVHILVLRSGLPKESCLPRAGSEFLELLEHQWHHLVVFGDIAL